MMQVKLIRQKAQLIEGEINGFLRQIGGTPYTKTSLEDIKLVYHEKDDSYTALVIFNQVAVQQTKR